MSDDATKALDEQLSDWEQRMQKRHEGEKREAQEEIDLMRAEARAPLPRRHKPIEGLYLPHNERLEKRGQR